MPDLVKEWKKQHPYLAMLEETFYEEEEKERKKKEEEEKKKREQQERNAASAGEVVDLVKGFSGAGGSTPPTPQSTASGSKSGSAAGSDAGRGSTPSFVQAYQDTATRGRGDATMNLVKGMEETLQRRKEAETPAATKTITLPSVAEIRSRAVGTSSGNRGVDRLNSLLATAGDEPANAASKAALREFQETGSTVYGGKRYTLPVTRFQAKQNQEIADAIRDMGQIGLYLRETEPRTVTEAEVRGAKTAAKETWWDKLGNALNLSAMQNATNYGVNLPQGQTAAVDEAQRRYGQSRTDYAAAVESRDALARLYTQQQAEAAMREAQRQPDFYQNSRGNAELAASMAGSTDHKAQEYAQIFYRKDDSRAKEMQSQYTGFGKAMMADDFAAQERNPYKTGSELTFINDLEAANYFYIWNTQGADAASAYIETIRPTLNARRDRSMARESRAYAQNNPVGASVYSVAANQFGLLGVIDLTVQNAQMLFGGKTTPIDYNTAAQDLGKQAQRIRGQVSSDIAQKSKNKAAEKGKEAATLFGTNASAFLYNSLMSMADSSVGIVLNTFGVPEAFTLSLMAGSAAQQAVYDAKERGASDGQALLYGYAAGAAEYAFEKISLDHFTEAFVEKTGQTIGEKVASKWFDGNMQKIAAWIADGLIQGGVEASEETFTSLANTLSDAWIMADKREITKNIEANMQALRQEHPDWTEDEIEKEATKAAVTGFWNGLALDAAGGLISGGVMGLAGGGVRLGVDSMAGTGKNIRAGRQTTALQNAAANAAENREQTPPVPGQAEPAETPPAPPAPQRAAEAAERKPFTLPTLPQRVAGNNGKAILSEPGKIKEQFKNDLDLWMENTTPEQRINDGGRFLIGHTSEQLRQANVDDYDIYFGKSKIARILMNIEMTPQIIKEVADVVENPVVVMDSKTVPGAITMFGDSQTANGKPVMVSMLLHPTTKTGEILDYGVVTSAYGRRKSNAQNLIDSSNIRYIDPDTKRTGEWMKTLGLQLPSASSVTGESNVPQGGGAVNTLPLPPIPKRTNTSGIELPGIRTKEDTQNGEQAQTAAAAERSFRERARELAGQNADGGERHSRLGQWLEDLRSRRSSEERVAEQRRESARLKNEAASGNLTAITGAEAGITDGSDEQTAFLMPERLMSDAQKEAVRRYAEQGTRLQFIIGQLGTTSTSRRGDPISVRAFISDNGNIYVQADHSRLSWEQLLDHEELHREIRNNPALRQKIMDALLSDKRVAPWLSEILDRYAEAYDEMGVTDENEVIDEMLADYRAGFDMLDVAGKTAVERLGDYRTKAAAREAIRGAEQETGSEGGTQRGAERYSREVEREFQRDFTGEIRTARGVRLSKDEYSAVSHALKTGYGQLSTEGDSGVVNTKDFCYYYGVNEDGSVTVYKRIRHEALNRYQSVVEAKYGKNRNSGTSDGSEHESGDGSEGRADRVGSVGRGERYAADDSVDRGERSGAEGYSEENAGDFSYVERVNKNARTTYTQRIPNGNSQNTGSSGEGNRSIEIDPEEAALYRPEAIARRQAQGRKRNPFRERKVSRVRSNTYEESGLFNEVEAQMDEADPSNYEYDPISEKRSMNEARSRLKADFDGEVSRLSDADHAWGGSDLDTAMGILHRYRSEGRATGDYTDFWNWSKVIQEKGTKGGQFIQAFAKYTRTGTGQAQKAAEALRKQYALNPAQQKRVDEHKARLLNGIEEDAQGAADGALQQAKGQRQGRRKAKPGEVQRMEDAEHLIREIYGIFNRRQQNHGAPVGSWIDMTGEELAKRIASRFNTRTTPQRTTMQTILSDLVGFAEEHALPERQRAEGERRTAIDTITDYLSNRDAYGAAWAQAQAVLRAQYAQDQEKLDALEGFLGATIAYNAEGTDRTMLDAILQSADVLGISEKRILELASAGVTESTVERIGDELVSQVRDRMGEDWQEEFGQQLRDAVRRHVTGIALSESTSEQAQRLGRLETAAARELDIDLQKLLTESRLTKQDASRRVADYLIRELGIPAPDAAVAGQRIGESFMDELAARADRRLGQMFGEKTPKAREQRDKLLDLLRLGGFTNANIEDAVADALGIGKLSREEQRRITGDMARFGETLDAMMDDDLDGLRQLIREQAAVRRTKLSRMSEKILDGTTDFEYLKDFAMAQLASIAGDYAPRSTGEKISTYQTISHLLNTRTALRNVTSNQIFDLIDSAANNVSMLPDMVLGLMTGKRTVGLNKSWASRQKRQGAVQGARRNLLEVNLDVGVDDRQKSKYGTAGRRTWNLANSNTAGKIMSHLEEVLGYELNTTDELHKGSVMGETLESLARFVDRGDMTLEEAQDFATEMALYRSFQDDSMIGTMLSAIKDALNIAGVGEKNGKKVKGKSVHDFGLGDFMTKYTQVPGALVHRAIEFSPLGYVKALYNLGQLATQNRRGENTNAAQRKAALAFGRATTGWGLLAALTALVKKGLIRRDDKEDKNAKAAHQAQGLSGTQFNLTAVGRWINGESTEPQDGDVLMDVNFLEPLDALMGLAALVAEDDDRSVKSLMNDSITAVWESVSSLSMMQTLRDCYQVYQYYDENDKDHPLINQLLLEIASSSMSGFVPSPLRQLAQATDTTYRDQYRSKDVNDQIKAKFMNSIPALRQRLAPKITPLGEDRKYENTALNALNATLAPGNISIYKSDKIVDELDRVYGETGDAKIWPERNAPYSVSVGEDKYTLTPDERTQYQRTRGQTTDALMREVMKTDEYQSMDPVAQAEELNWLGNYANYLAKQEMLAGRGVEYSSAAYEKVNSAVEAGISIPTYRAYKAAASKMTADGVQGGKKAKVVDYIAGLDLTKDQKDWLYRDAGYAESGIDDTPWHKSGGGGGGGQKDYAPAQIRTLRLPEIPKANTAEARSGRTSKLRLPEIPRAGKTEVKRGGLTLPSAKIQRRNGIILPKKP
jgi:hypothetical protein